MILILFLLLKSLNFTLTALKTKMFSIDFREKITNYRKIAFFFAHGLHLDPEVDM